MAKSTVLMALVMIAVVMGGSAFILGLRPISASGGGGGGCPSSCVTSLNSLVNSITLAVFSSLNLTVVGQNINIGLALGHQNYWSAQQTFNANVNFGTTSTIDYLNTCYLQFSTFPLIKPCVDDSLQLGSLNQRIYSVVSEDFFVPAIKGDIYGASKLSYNGVGGYLSLGALTNSTAQDVMLERNAAKTLSFYTFDSGDSFIQRLQINGNAAQGSAGITSYESISPNNDLTLNLGSSSNHWATTFTGTVESMTNDLKLIERTNTANIDFQQGNTVMGKFDNNGLLHLYYSAIAETGTISVNHASGDSNPTSQLGDGFLKLGVGGASALDMSISRAVTAFGINTFIMQSLGSNTAQGLMILPSGSNNQALLGIQRTSSLSNIEALVIESDNGNFGSNLFDIRVTATGSGSLRPLLFAMSGTEAFRITTTPTVDFYNGNANKVFQVSTTGIGNTQGYQSIIAAALTNPSSSTTINLPVAEPDTSYAVTCTPNASGPGAIWITGKTTAHFVVNYAAIAVGGDTVDCIITHQ